MATRDVGGAFGPPADPDEGKRDASARSTRCGQRRRRRCGRVDSLRRCVCYHEVLQCDVGIDVTMTLMAGGYEIALSLNIGAGAPFETVVAPLADFSAFCAFASELQRTYDNTYAVARAVQRELPRQYTDRDVLFLSIEGLSFWPESLAARLQPEVERILDQIGADANAEIRVSRIHYENPIEWVILASGVVVIALLKVIRDWPAHRRVKRAAALDYENEVETRRQLRALIVERFRADGIALSSKQIDELLSGSTVQAIKRLGDAGVDVGEFKELPLEDDK